MQQRVMELVQVFGLFVANKGGFQNNITLAWKSGSQPVKDRMWEEVDLRTCQQVFEEFRFRGTENSVSVQPQHLRCDALERTEKISLEEDVIAEQQTGNSEPVTTQTTDSYRVIPNRLKARQRVSQSSAHAIRTTGLLPSCI